MNQQDTTMMIAAHIVAALAAQTGENVFDPLTDEDYTPDPQGTVRKNPNGGFYVPYGASTAIPENERYRIHTTYEQRIARYAAKIADLTVHAVQRKLNAQ